MYYAQIDDVGKIHTKSILSGEVNAPNLIKIDETMYKNQDLLFCRYVDGKFVGYFIDLQVDKNTILANGVDFATITATVRDWQGKFTGQDIAIDFDVNGHIVTEQAIDGVAKIEVDAIVAGIIEVRSIVAGYGNRGVQVYAE